MEVERETEQELEWRKAQNIVISLDLLAAAKTQLEFLAAVDRNRWLYEGSTLEKAIYRYKACWLPLLAKHAESQLPESSLVVPIDCEWVWHCHRLNPVRYKTDCEELYGKILDNTGVVSSVKGICTAYTEEIWNRLYPDEPYHFDFTRLFSNIPQLEKSTTYDLVSAVTRQSPFYYQVSRPHFSNDVFLEDAVARYKGFLHLIKRNTERAIKCFSVPTYDIDLIWHTHQLHPVSYCKDLTQAVGKILEHDDMDSDRTKGKKLDVGFSVTIRRWQETFGTRYQKAGAMYRGTAPSPVTAIPFASNILCKEVANLSEYEKMIQIPELKIVEVLLQIVGVKNLPEGHKGNLFVAFSKKQTDAIFNVKRNLTIMSESGDRHVTSFHCESTGDLFFELVSHSPSNLLVTKSIKTLGTYSLSLQNLLNPLAKLTVEKWVELQSDSGNLSSKPICLRIAISFGVPVQGTRVLHMRHPSSLLKSCFVPLSGMAQHDKDCTHIVDQTHADVISLRMRDSTMVKGKYKSILKNQVVAVMKSGETHTVAEFVGTRWSLLGSEWFLQSKSKSSENGHLFDLVGSRMVKIFLGRKLDFEPKHCEKQRNEQAFMTAVEFSAEDPYGKAVALLDLKYGIVKVKEAPLLLPVIISAFIISKTWKKKGYEGFNGNEEHLKEVDSAAAKVDTSNEESKLANLTTSAQLELGLNENVIKANMVKDGGSAGGGYGTMESGGCGSGCGGGECGSMVNSGGCGSGCGGKCGNMMNGGGCGSGCGGKCGSMMNGGCGGKCGNMMNGGGCSSGCCGVMKSGGCGSSCGGGGGCGNMMNGGGCGGGGCDGGCGHLTAETGVLSAEMRQ